jgi:UDP-glucose 4-epimerase
MKILVTGAAGFICGYLIQDLLENGHEVVGLDNFSKYGRSQKSYDSHPRYQFAEGDAKDAELLKELLADSFCSSGSDDWGNILLSRIRVRFDGRERTNHCGRF